MSHIDENALPIIVNNSANAKVNLYLHVTGKASSGYHNLDTLAVFTKFGDEVRLEFSKVADASNASYQNKPSDQINLSVKFDDELSYSDNIYEDISSNNNIIYKSTSYYLDYIRSEVLKDVYWRCDFKLLKKIPIGAGLGGGSADAGAVLRLLEEALLKFAYQSDNLKSDNLAIINFIKSKAYETGINKIAMKLGSDVPMCFTNKPLIMRGIGDDCKILNDDITSKISGKSILLFNPLIHNNTKDVFIEYNNQVAANKISYNKIRSDLFDENINSWADFIKMLRATSNDLEEVALKKNPKLLKSLEQIKQILNDFKGDDLRGNDCLDYSLSFGLVRMSGSGLTFYILFNHDDDAIKILKSKIKEVLSGFWVKETFLL